MLKYTYIISVLMGINNFCLHTCCFDIYASLSYFMSRLYYSQSGVSFAGSAFQAEYFATKFQRRGQLAYVILYDLRHALFLCDEFVNVETATDRSMQSKTSAMDSKLTDSISTNTFGDCSSSVSSFSPDAEHMKSGFVATSSNIEPLALGCAADFNMLNFQSDTMLSMVRAEPLKLLPLNFNRELNCTDATLPEIIEHHTNASVSHASKLKFLSHDRRTDYYIASFGGGPGINIAA